MNPMDTPTLLDLPTALIDDVCFGLAPLADIFEKYGYPTTTATSFGADPRFQRHITLRTAELDKEGVTHKVRVGRLAEKAMATAFMRLDDPSIPFAAITEIYKVAAANAGYAIKNTEVQAAGAGFSVVINLGGAQTDKRVETVEVIAVPQRDYSNSEFEVVD